MHDQCVIVQIQLADNAQRTDRKSDGAPSLFANTLAPDPMVRLVPFGQSTGHTQNQRSTADIGSAA